MIKRKKEKQEEFFGKKTKGNIRNFVRWKTQNSVKKDRKNHSE